MSKTTEAYTVAEGTTVLDGKAVDPSKPIEMDSREALYHAAIGRLVPAKAVRRSPVKKRAGDGGGNVSSDKGEEA